MSNEWISFVDQQPKIDEFVLFVTSGGDVFIDHWDKDLDIQSWIIYTAATHWMPLPEPPNA